MIQIRLQYMNMHKHVLKANLLTAHVSGNIKEVDYTCLQIPQSGYLHYNKVGTMNGILCFGPLKKVILRHPVLFTSR